MLKDHLDWEKLMKCSRDAGGHEDIMFNLFKGSVVIDYFIQDKYQGDEIFLYKLNGEYILVCDYFGSCPGCDAYENCTDEELKNLCIQLANNARKFNSMSEVFNFLEYEVDKDKSAYFDVYSIKDDFIKKLKENIIIQRINKLSSL